MKAIRRIGTETPADTWGKLRRGALRRVPLTEEAFRAIERDTPERVVIDGDGVLVAEQRPGRVDLHYAFADRASFARRFPAMLERIAPLFTPNEAPFGLFLRLTLRSQRAYVEPALFAQGFELSREWMRMELDKLPKEKSTSDILVPGFRLRAARIEDAALILELDVAAFPSPVGTVETTASDIQRDHMRILEDGATRRGAGFLQVHCHYAPTGWISNIALHPDYQGRGLGEAVMRWAFAWLRAQGVERAALTVNTDNARAIALYRKLGFVEREIGIDYRRPVDPDELRQVLDKQRAEHISVRRRY